MNLEAKFDTTPMRADYDARHKSPVYFGYTRRSCEDEDNEAEARAKRERAEDEKVNRRLNGLCLLLQLVLLL